MNISRSLLKHIANCKSTHQRQAATTCHQSANVWGYTQRFNNIPVQASYSEANKSIWRNESDEWDLAKSSGQIFIVTFYDCSFVATRIGQCPENVSFLSKVTELNILIQPTLHTALGEWVSEWVSEWVLTIATPDGSYRYKAVKR
jgi:hypothetical protein